jgi:hypothetical protein
MMTTRSGQNPGYLLLHAAFVGAAITLFIFVLCWAGEATGFYPPASRLIEFITSSSEIRSHNAFWRGAASAALFGAVVAALIAFCAQSLARALRTDR